MAGRAARPVAGPRSRSPAAGIDLRRSPARSRRQRRAPRLYRQRCREAGGKLIIPSFAIGRVEEVLYWLKRLEEEKRIPVLFAQPAATSSIRIYNPQPTRSFNSELKLRVQGMRRGGHARAAAGRRRRRDQAARPQLSARVEPIDSMSAHADYSETMRWPVHIAVHQERVDPSGLM